jgi:hypothetical protein
MTDQRLPVTGGCLCGAVRYESSEPPVQGFFCHCVMCQKNYGGLYAATLKFSGEGFRFTDGEPKYYHSSGFAKRGFCAECGSPIVFLYEGNPHHYVLIGSLDHPADWPLRKDASWGQSAHWYIEAKVPWYEIGDGLPQRGEAPAAVVARLHTSQPNANWAASGSCFNHSQLHKVDDALAQARSSSSIRS